MLYFFENTNNNIGTSTQGNYFISSVSNNKHGLPCIDKNLRHSISLFTARRLVISSFEIKDNVYYAPLNNG
jgi:predicted proteasome-type protease